MQHRLEPDARVSSIQNKKYQHLRATVDADSKAKKRADSREGELIYGHVCGKHAEVMDPRLWSTLPESLLELIFARLLPHRIDGVRLLSKAWKSAVCTDTVFQGLRAQASTSINWNNVRSACFDYRMFDFIANWWRKKCFELDDGRSPLSKQLWILNRCS